MSKRIRIVENAVERTARMLSKQYGIRVVWQGTECKTNGNTIFLPILPDDAPDALLEAVQGFVDHEAAHIIFTDFNVWKQTTPVPNKEQWHCINIIEDVRIEEAISRLFPGSPYNLHKAHDWVFAKLERDWDKILPFYKACSSYFDYVKYGKTPFWDQVEPEIQDLVLKCVKEVGPHSTIQTTKDGILAGLRMYEVLKDLAEEAQEAREAKESAEKKSEGASQSGRGQTKEGQTAQLGQVSMDGSKSLGETLQAEATQVMEGLKDKLKGGNGYTHNQNNDHTYLPWSTKEDTVESFPDYTTQGGGSSLHRFREESRELSSVIKTRLVNSLRATSRSRWLSNKEEGKLDTKKLHRVLTSGATNVYKVKTDKVALNTVVGLAIDHSGSMNGSRLELAGKSAIVMGDALNTLKIPFMVYGYSTSSPTSVLPRELGAYARWNALWIRYYRDFNDPWETGALRLANSRNNCKDNTLDAESVLHGIRRLLARPEKRKILFVFNDGMPYPGYGNVGRCQQRLRDVVESAKQAGVEVVAFGIQSTDVKEYYPNHVVIQNLGDLVKEPLTLLDKMLRKGVTKK